MNLIKLSLRNLGTKPLSTGLSLLLLVLGVAIISLLININKQFENQFDRNISGIDMVVGAKGSPLQLILSSIFHIDAPTGNIPLEEANDLIKNPLIEWGIPMAYGDNYRSYRILGTSKAYLDHYKAIFSEGNLWKKEFEAVIGFEAARKLGLNLGDTFYSSHGLLDDFQLHEEEPYTICGILRANGSVLDQLILTGMESVWQVHDHNEDETDDHHNGKDKDITAMLIKFRNPAAMVSIPRLVNEQTSMQAALPAIEVNRLLNLMDSGIKTLRILAIIIIVISGLSVFISLFNSLLERRYELALMRVMGGSRTQVFSLIILESLILSLSGYLIGLLLGRIGLWVISMLVSSSFHYSLALFSWDILELQLLGLVILIAVLVALIPATMASRTDISKTLAES